MLIRPTQEPVHPSRFSISRNRWPALTLCFHAIPKGKRYALLPGKPLRTFPGIALGETKEAFRPGRFASAS
ncbi:hypothetical protein EN845_26260 [Mesorhizobium sp. M8A.F.Ca.ET.202.01.1.1]|nr:hypothetical protein EOA36_03360 [Mesorhizobium sp. M8A.F.Ca.ET.021.01.1.1]TGQ78566.1 hypothetical protein EN850_21465 [Mesorhizobium sp. M8A.F.Ca.ET.207.01.1.1]TGR20091.1 hypothetical protein EN845_26260 [Mesorhizobium sp. M8A.F.Ca.ET.202.01.1.1]TGR21383.1 hypothetical protein EN840_26090 [Mesorhizobium sp. M8A.F.Ca.ET.197.01.1.1]TGR38408.1 hypothetical protein EN842_46135 [bacterium M00.F.Ca.ET.199.01.1.1]TGR44691.1 hypothetical protein EN841_26085 [Mesorhizobium sp. M8A.F.Ca.ET.198.01.1.